MLVMSLGDEIPEAQQLVMDLAAAAEQKDIPRPTMLKRLPIDFNPAIRIAVKQRLAYEDSSAVSNSIPLERPQGSLEARSFGNAVHAFLEILTKRLAEGTAVEALLREISGWSTRIAAVLRGDGLAPGVVGRLVARVKTALGNVLQDPDGLWLLAPLKQASSEIALTSWNGKFNHLRMDRIFFAGEEPLSLGTEHLWIIDYKTTSHGREDLDKFLAEERAKYTPQMSAYAEMMKDKAQPGKIRVGLYYVMLPKLIWWEI
jgi:hypothetical protein